MEHQSGWKGSPSHLDASSAVASIQALHTISLLDALISGETPVRGLSLKLPLSQNEAANTCL